MAKKKNTNVPRYSELLEPTFAALKQLGGSGTNDEIHDKVVVNLLLSDNVVDAPHIGIANQSELQYQLAWARTYLKNYGAITNSARSVWSINTTFASCDAVDKKTVLAVVSKQKIDKQKKLNGDRFESPIDSPEDSDPQNDDVEFPEEVKPWRIRLAEVLLAMDPFAFERLSQRLLRECGFSQVEVTKKTGDGGIDGTGKLRINGMVSFNVAFQCKRYKGLVSPGDIRAFRGSLTNNIEKGIFITTGTFSKAAREEAANLAKQQIDLIDGEEFINKLAEYGIGMKEVKDYEIDEEFFKKI